MAGYIIIGAGPAGILAAERIRLMEEDAQITVISTDEHVHSRCMLHKYLSHDRSAEKISFIPEDFFEKNRIDWIKGKRVKKVTPAQKTVELEDGTVLPYQKLLLATGAGFVIPPIEHFREAPNVYGFRDLSDAEALDEAVKGKKRVFIVGSGLVGLDAACALCERGYDVSIAEMAPRVMPLQTDDYAASVYQRAFEKAGCRFYLGIGVTGSEVNEKGEISTVLLSDGTRVPCDVVLVAAGVRPKVDYLEGSGIKIGRGVEVNEYLETNIPDIYAAGDVNGLSGVWPDAMDQGKTAAMNMCGVKLEYEKPYPFKNTSNFFGIAMLSIGKIDPVPEDAQEVTAFDRGTYKKAIIKDDKLQAILIQGDIANTGIYLKLIKDQIPLNGKDVFSLSFADYYGIDERTAAFVYQTE